VIDKRIKIGPPYLTKYERAKIIGARALQISLGAPVLIPLPEGQQLSPFFIAERELESGALPLTIRRRLPTGEYQDIPVAWLVESPIT